MKKGFVNVLILMCMLMTMGLSACSKVDKGYEGALINTLGSDKGGVKIVTTGRHWYNPWKYDMIQTPTFVQDYTWETPEDVSDGAITFQSSNSLKFSANVGISMSLKEGMSGAMYEDYHKEMKELIRTNMSNSLRDKFQRHASKREAEDIYGAGKTQFIVDVADDMRRTWGKYFTIHEVYFLGTLNPPKSIREAIENKIKATQKAQQRENEIAEEDANARKLEKQAEGKRIASKKKTDAATYDIIQKAEAKAEAIRLINEQLAKSPEYIKYSKVERWDGVMPSTLVVGEDPVEVLDVGSK